MKRALHRWLILISLSSTLAIKDPDLPVCPTNIQYFPQNLPMHCRMPGNSEQRPFPEMQQFPTLPPLPESFYQSPPPDKQAPPIPIPIPPFPGMPGAMPMPGQMGGPLPGMPGPMPMPIPIVGGPPHKLPVIVMPFYSPDNSFKKQQIPRRPKKKPSRKKKKSRYNSDTDTSSEETSSSGTSDDSHSSDEHGFWKGRRKARRKITRRFNKRRKTKKKERKNKKNKKDLLTPILQYVTKDGYVIFEKTITKGEAKDWLKPKNEVNVLEEPKREEKDQEIMQKSVEEPRSKSPKGDIEEIQKRIIEKSGESAEVEPTTERALKRYRLKKAGPLMNKPNFMP